MGSEMLKQHSTGRAMSVHRHEVIKQVVVSLLWIAKLSSSLLNIAGGKTRVNSIFIALILESKFFLKS